MPGLNYATWSAALIPREGIVLGAIDPAKNMLEDGIIAEKKTQQKSRADAKRTRYLPKEVVKIPRHKNGEMSRDI